ncbi:MAG: hypothetical protein HY530_00685 [Chloroflexi bacterium]|nr:hypothetical protein [Chloroflexota bacterium]
MATMQEIPGFENNKLSNIFEEYKKKIDDIVAQEQQKKRDTAEQEAEEILETAWSKAETIIAEGHRKADSLAEEIKQKAREEADELIAEARIRARGIAKEAEDKSKKEARERTKKEIESILYQAGEEAKTIVAGAEKEISKVRDKVREEAEREGAEIIEKARLQAASEAAKIVADAGERVGQMTDEALGQIEETNVLISDLIQNTQSIVERYHKDVTNEMERARDIIAKAKNKMESTKVREEVAVFEANKAALADYTENQVFEGRQKLAVESYEDYKQIARLKDFLKRVSHVKLAGEHSSEEDVVLHVDIDQPIPLLDILRTSSLIESCEAQDGIVRLALSRGVPVT